MAKPYMKFTRNKDGTVNFRVSGSDVVAELRWGKLSKLPAANDPLGLITNITFMVTGLTLDDLEDGDELHERERLEKPFALKAGE